MPGRSFAIVMLCSIWLLSSCTFLDQYFPDKRLDYLSAEELPPLSIPDGLNARTPDPLLPIPALDGARDNLSEPVDAYTPSISELSSEIEAIRSGDEPEAKKRRWWSRKRDKDSNPNTTDQ